MRERKNSPLKEMRLINTTDTSVEATTFIQFKRLQDFKIVTIGTIKKKGTEESSMKRLVLVGLLLLAACGGADEVEEPEVVVQLPDVGKNA